MTSGNSNNNASEDPGLYKTIKKDFKEGDIFTNIKRDFSEIKEFYISPERKKRLDDMNSVKRFFVLMWWILRSMILKLTPARRILLLIGIIACMTINTSGNNNKNSNTSIEINLLGGSLILLVLMLELKDKLLAKDELEAGRKVQESLMPEESPLLEGWSLWLYTRPANEVCGDLVDYIKINPERAGIVMADVAGKGLNAALLTAKLQATVRAYADDDDPVRIVSRVNNIFFRDSLRKIFASLLYLQILPNSNKLIYVNAGHLPPVIVKSDGTSEMPKGETALGLMKDMTYTLHQADLNSGEVFICYSDGVTESRNKEGSFFGSERFLKLLPSLISLTPKDIGLKIISETDIFSRDTRPNDDLSLIIIKRI
jgi:sigma-B regulation protein RsbU (phosphoserine phosphatase)